MICRSCLRRASLFAPLRTLTTSRAAFSTSLLLRNAAAPAPATAAATPNLDPLIPTPADDKPSISSCPAGTVLNGLNYTKGKNDPVALPDEEYPAWLWGCLEVKKKEGNADGFDAADEFSKSKKTRRLAAKRKEALQAKLLASGNLEALAPKVPLPEQSVNLPDGGDGSVESALVAAEKREELRKALRKDRKAKIKESNYLKTM